MLNLKKDQIILEEFQKESKILGISQILEDLNIDEEIKLIKLMLKILNENDNYYFEEIKKLKIILPFLFNEELD